MIKKLLFISALLFAFSAQAQVIFEETFDDESSLNNWTLGDRDGDGEFWEFADAGDQEVDSFTTGFLWSFSWYFEVFTPDNTFISPAISLPADSNLNLSFKVAAFEDDELFQEHYAVYVIPSDASFEGTETAVFEETLDAAYYDPAKTVNVDISEFAGQDVKLVFRHYDSTDIFYISMDDVKIEIGNLGTSDLRQEKIKIYPNPTTDFVSIKGLDNVKGIRIFNLEGKMMKEVASSTASMKDLVPGMYIINFYTDTEVISKKVLKK
ncbi:choice-of-anchor J domain-containing protein [Weeksellaceae bacterium KMM 9724]|uniref:T9SS-dependent choice-of-anchor J family protein n=1 Tax=Profundicola chukchiensis TaxID=2961959 RepID=UPI00243AD521|nr:choice-of-anchor J domain-containing protein [Profundicola chukchiensis]MDG4950920.1 choice-of-anchor J domain-containing protein [Profundicola chukchiensis]